LINLVQGRAVRTVLAGSAAVELPILSIAAPFYRAAAIPAGPVSA